PPDSGATERGDDADDFLDKNGPSQKSGCPVLLAEGFKTESDVDLVVALPGEDFVLRRVYNAGADIDEPGYPWYLGTGWGTSADGWIQFEPRRMEWHEHPLDLNPYPDSVQVSVYPIEESGFFYDTRAESPDGLPPGPPEDPIRGKEFEPITPGLARVRAGVVHIEPGFGRTDGTSGIVSSPSHDPYRCWIYDTPGGGQTIYSRKPGYYEGRVLRYLDAFGNPWTYDYVEYTPGANGRPVVPRLLRIFLHGTDPVATGGGAFAARAVVEFEWDTVKPSVPGSGGGRMLGARVTRPGLPASINDRGLSYVKYSYQVVPGAAPNGSDEHLLSLVEKGVLVNAPLEGESAPAGFEPEYHITYTHFRYAGRRLSHRFDAAQLEHYAEHLYTPPAGTQSPQERLAAAADEFSHLPLNAGLGGGTATVADLASKIVSYSKIHDSWRVVQEIIQQGCPCAGAGGSATKINYAYGRSWIAEPEQVWKSAPGPNGQTTITTKLGRWKTVTTITESSRDETGAWQVDQVKRSWAEMVPILIGPQPTVWSDRDPEVIPPSPVVTTIEFRPRLLVPFTVANAITEYVDGQPGRSWYTLHEYLDGSRAREYHPSALTGVLLDENGCLEYSDEAANVLLGTQRQDGPAPAAREAFQFKPDGLITWTRHDALGRMTESGVERSSVSGPPSAWSVPAAMDARVAERRSYLASAAGAGVGNLRYDLVSRIDRFTDGQTGPTDSVVHDYATELGTSNLITDWRRPRVVARAERTERGREAGPPGDAVSWRRFDATGALIFTCDPSGTVIRYTNDPSTGRPSRIDRNVASPGGALLPPTAGVRHLEGALTTHITNDILGRPRRTIEESGVISSTDWSLERADLLLHDGVVAPSTLEYLVQTVTPHELAGGTHAGAISKTWLGASLNILGVREFEGASGQPTERETGRTLHDYAFGEVLRASRRWHDVAGDRFTTESFEYDRQGRVSRRTAANGQVTETEYDSNDRPVAVRSGASGRTPVLQTEFFYDFDPLSAPPGGAPAQGVGDGHMTLVRQHVQDSAGAAARDLISLHDYRGRKRVEYARAPGPGWLEAAAGQHSVVRVDNTGRVVERATFGAGVLNLATLESLIRDTEAMLSAPSLGTAPFAGRSWTLYSERGLPVAVDVALNGVSDSAGVLRSTWAYDHNGRVIAEFPGGGAASLRNYDALGRLSEEAVALGESPGYSSTGVLIASALLIEHSTTGFDDATGLPFLETTARRTHGASEQFEGFSELPVTTLTAFVHDEAARPIATVSYGTNRADDTFSAGGVPPISAPLVGVPDRVSNPNLLIQETRYDPIGRPSESIDAQGRVTRSIYDDFDRVVGVVENASAATPTAPGIGLVWSQPDGHWSVVGRPTPGAHDKDRVTSTVYDGAGLITRRAAHVPRLDALGQVLSEDIQVTQFVYDRAEASSAGLGALGNASESNGLLYEVRYPATAGPSMGRPGADESDIVRYAYNSAGEQTAVRDQRGVVRRFERDHLGRVLADRADPLPVLTGGFSIDGAVTSLVTGYDPFGRVQSVRSVGGAGGVEVRNEVKFEYDARGRITRYLQNPVGAVSAPVENAVQYAYDDLGFGTEYTQHGRLREMTYPFTHADGRRTRVRYDYGPSGSLGERISRLAGMQWSLSGTTFDSHVEHSYLGAGRRVKSVYRHDPPGSTPEPTLVRDRTVPRLGEGAAVAGRYPGYDRFGRLARHLWYRDEAWDRESVPPIVEVNYRYDRSSNTTHRLDDRPGMSGISGFEPRRFNDAYEHDGLDRLTKAMRGVDASSPEPGADSQRWTLDTLGNWLTSAAATNELGGFDRLVHRSFNATNEVSAADSAPGLPGGELGHLYDDAGNLLAEQQADDAFLTQRRRVFTYDAWNRLTRVSLQTRADAQSAWS
ncbi:MAG TPA: hypothetical protein DEB06_01490, partial [Phycisphaerales bacterium]|nr:hypothetical protein [Phycisphaerales bacterium]